MVNRRLKKLLLLVVVAGLVVFVDQLSKALALTHLSPVYPVKVIDGFFSLTLVLNSGVAFGLFSRAAASWKTTALLVLSAVTVLLLLWYYFYDDGLNRLLMLAFCLVVGGAAGNIIDRLKFGRVVDFLDFYWRSYHWPAFNLADSAITVGIALMLVGSCRRQKGSGNASDSFPVG
ncbi:MAG: signal peptidase II [Deltaproteobacteria bacterium]|jgi:signal peptidase II|nr:signal peptidase II [Deltaproteobacteria bacterium]